MLNFIFNNEMNDWYTIGLIPGILGDIVGGGDEQLDGYNGDNNYFSQRVPSVMESMNRDPKGPGATNPNPYDDSRGVIEIEQDGTIYVFDGNGNYITDYPSSERDYHDVYMDENGDIIHNAADVPQTAVPNMTPARDEYGNLIYIDENGHILYPETQRDQYGNIIENKPNVNPNQKPTQDEYENWIFIDDNGNEIEADSYMDGNANTIVVHPTTGEHINVDQMNPTTSVPSSAPMTDYAGNTFFTDSNGNYVDINGNPYEPVLNPPVVETYYDELGNLWDSDGNLIEPAPENNGSSNNNSSNNSGPTDELGNPIPGINDNTTNELPNNGSSNNNTKPQLPNNSGPTDEMGDPIPGLSGDNIINEPPELDSEDEDYEPPKVTTRDPVKYDKPTNFNSTIGSRAAYYAP